MRASSCKRTARRRPAEHRSRPPGSSECEALKDLKLASASRARPCDRMVPAELHESNEFVRVAPSRRNAPYRSSRACTAGRPARTVPRSAPSNAARRGEQLAARAEPTRSPASTSERRRRASCVSRRERSARHRDARPSFYGRARTGGARRRRREGSGADGAPVDDASRTIRTSIDVRRVQQTRGPATPKMRAARPTRRPARVEEEAWQRGDVNLVTAREPLRVVRRPAAEAAARADGGRAHALRTSVPRWLPKAAPRGATPSTASDMHRGPTERRAGGDGSASATRAGGTQRARSATKFSSQRRRARRASCATPAKLLTLPELLEIPSPIKGDGSASAPDDSGGREVTSARATAKLRSRSSPLEQPRTLQNQEASSRMLAAAPAEPSWRDAIRS